MIGTLFLQSPKAFKNLLENTVLKTVVARSLFSIRGIDAILSNNIDLSPDLVETETTFFLLSLLIIHVDTMIKHFCYETKVVKNKAYHKK